jgi:SWIB/MDM2 domain
VVSKVWDYIKKNNLQNPSNKREIVADDKLRAVFGKDSVTMFEMNKWFCQGSRQCPWPTGAWSGIGPPLTEGVDEDAVLGMWVAGRHGAIRAHCPGLSPVPLPRMWQAVQRA